jgi:hypothetical protein
VGGLSKTITVCKQPKKRPSKKWDRQKKVRNFMKFVAQGLYANNWGDIDPGWFDGEWSDETQEDLDAHHALFEVISNAFNIMDKFNWGRCLDDVSGD